MEAAYFNKNLTSYLSMEEAMLVFFKENTVESVQVLFWKFFQCWVTRECKLISDLSDNEIAHFFDQLIDLIAAAHMLHEANRVSDPQSKEGSND
jgi:hypothetical protein